MKTLQVGKVLTPSEMKRLGLSEKDLEKMAEVAKKRIEEIRRTNPKLAEQIKPLPKNIENKIGLDILM